MIEIIQTLLYDLNHWKSKTKMLQVTAQRICSNKIQMKRELILAPSLNKFFYHMGFFFPTFPQGYKLAATKGN